LRRHWKVVPRRPAGLRARERDPARRDRQCHAWGLRATPARDRFTFSEEPPDNPD